MAGIYIHVPFCKTRCIYCDFYSTTRNDLTSRYTQALCQELRARKEYLSGEPIETIYFGGGTPSQLQEEHLTPIFNTLAEVYDLSQVQEVTMEVNPDDITEEYTRLLQQFPFNRISMGIQTFNDATLKLLNRRHNALQAQAAVRQLRQAGFRNISIDLIYGLPNETEAQWATDLQQALSLHVEHISAYHLTYEEGTKLHELLRQHQVEEVSEERSLRFFSQLIDTLQDAGYEHYEISNFALPGYRSRHNTSYWKGIPYMGCGPSAHSFNRHSREWNEASLTRYLEGMEAGIRPFESEELNTDTRYNEYIMTALRTCEGISIPRITSSFGEKRKDYCLQAAIPHLKEQRLEQVGHHLRLTRKGIFLSDSLISDLMWIDD